MSKKKPDPDTEALEYGTGAPDFERSQAQRMVDDGKARRRESTLQRQRQIEDTIRKLTVEGLNQQTWNKDGTPVSKDFNR